MAALPPALINRPLVSPRDAAKMVTGFDENIYYREHGRSCVFLTFHVAFVNLAGHK